VNFFGGQTIASITRNDIADYKAHLEKKIAVNAKKVEVTVDGKKKMVAPTLSGESVRKYLTRLRKMLNEARRDYGNLPEYDFSGDMMPEKKKPRSLTIDFFELDRLLEACTGRQSKMRLLAIALHETGARLSEVVGNEKRLSHLPGVKREDVDLENQRIRLWNSKLSQRKDPEQRTAYLSEFFRDALIDPGIENLQPDDLIFKRGDFRKSWQKVLEVAAIDPNFWERDFRHCFASNCAAGVPRAAIKHQINHAGDDLLEAVYTNVMESELTELYKPFETYSKAQRAKVEVEKLKQKTMRATA
jgi:integrase